MPGTRTPYPLASVLPGLFQEVGFTMRMCGGLDDILAPAIVTMDCLDAYLDPALTPPDFLEWLAGWVGLSLDQNWSESKRRELVAHAADLYRWQGTVRGVREHVRLYTGSEPEVTDSGGVSWSARAGGDLPGDPRPDLVVRVTVEGDVSIDESHLDTIVSAAKPAHVPHRLEISRS